jgi:type IV secretion system protein VirB6
MFSFSGPAIQCLTDTLKQNFYDNQSGCTGTNIDMKFLARFGEFQEALRAAVRALLIIYAMGFGFKIILNHQEFNLEQVVTFILKMVLVLYFSVGLGPAYFTDGVKKTDNGITKWVLPMMNQATANFATMTFRAGGNTGGLCDFDDTKYPYGYSYYSLWDRLDCKFGAYMFFKKIYGFGPGSAASSSRGSVICDGFREVAVQSDAGTSAVSPGGGSSSTEWLYAIAIPLLIGGSFIAFISLMYFSVIVIAIVLGFISLYTVCLVTLHGLIYMAPIFVPMALFERTKSYFDSWVNVTMSCMLQPMVMACAIGFVMSMYDSVLFGNCRFIRHDYSNGVRNYATFELKAPTANPGGCVHSIGYIILNYVMGYGGYSQGLIIFTVDYIMDELDLAAKAAMLIVFSYIMKFFMDALYPMAADITGGLNVVSVAFNMRAMAGAMNKKMKSSSKDKGKEKDAGDEKGGGDGDKGGGDKGGGGSGGSGS